MNMNPMGLPSSHGMPGRNSALATPNDPAYLARSFFCYELDAVNLTVANPTQNLTFTISKDADFFWSKFACHAVVGDDGTTVFGEELAEILITIQNSTTGRNYMTNPAPLANMSGSGRLPFILPMVTLWESLSTIAVTLQNVSDNKDYSDVRLSFLGIKAYLAPR
jgi:hypothetical protein